VRPLRWDEVPQASLPFDGLRDELRARGCELEFDESEGPDKT
jgi:hypothetical protein